jgi:hypothetical protein
VNGSVDSNSSHDPNNPFQLPDPPKFPNGGIFTPPQGGGANFSLGAARRGHAATRSTAVGEPWP